MSADASAPCDLLEWDTNFFQCRLARVRGDKLKPEQAQQIDDWCRHNHIRGLYFLAVSDDPSTMRTAEKNGFELIDVRVTLTYRNKSGKSTDAATASIREASSKDLPALQALARATHTDTRFFTDTRFPRHQAEALYSTWIALEFHGRAAKVLVPVSDDDEALGYITCHLDSKSGTGQIGLLGISEKNRGQGLGESLVMTALDWFANQKTREIAVVTQGRNISAQRLYQRCGFLTSGLQFWYHKWYPIAGGDKT